MLSNIKRFTLLFLLVVIGSCRMDDGFDAVHEEVQIKQNIGGILICNSTNDADLHSYQFNIQYKYRNIHDSIYSIGSGLYEGQEWPKDEQLVRLGRWTILKTSESRNADKLIIGVLETNHWTDYEISPTTIEQNPIWQNQKISSSFGNYDNISKIDKLNLDGTFSVTYTFAKNDRILSFKKEKRRINYEINIQTGKPEMKKISEM